VITPRPELFNAICSGGTDWERCARFFLSRKSSSDELVELDFRSGLEDRNFFLRRDFRPFSLPPGAGYALCKYK